MLMLKKISVEGVGIIGATFLIYMLSIIPLTKPFQLHLLIFVLIIFFSGLLFKIKNRNFIVYSLMSVLLLSVSVTGWFLSPFFYWLYLGAIIIAFIYSQIISTLFIGVLILILLPSLIGSFDLGWNMLTLISLLLIIPLTYYLRREYLNLKEKEKQILILEKDHQTYKNEVDEILANKVSLLAVGLREKINDISQLSFVVDKAIQNPKERYMVDNIRKLAIDAIKIIQKFEESATGKKMVSSS